MIFGFSQWKILYLLCLGEVCCLDDTDLECSRDTGFDASSVKLAISLCSVGVTHAEQGSCNLYGIVHGRAFGNTGVVKVSTSYHGWDRINKVVRGWGQSHAPNVVVDRDLRGKDIVVVCDASFLHPSHFFDRRRGNVFVAASMRVVRNTSSGIGNVVSNNSIGIGDLGPSELELGDNKGLAFLFQDLVDRDDFVVLILYIPER